MPENIFGPHGTDIRETTTRPTDTDSGSSLDTWFEPCQNGDPSTGTKIPSVWLNKITANMRSMVRGFAADESELHDDMASEGMAKAASLATFGVCSGTANDYVVSTTGATQRPKSPFTGMLVRTLPNVANTGATVVDVFGYGDKAVLDDAGAALTGGELAVARDTVWRYDAAADSGAGAWLVLPWANAATAISGDNLLSTINAAIRPSLVADKTLATISHETYTALGGAYDNTNFTGFDNSTFASGIFTVGTGEADVYDLSGYLSVQSTSGEVTAEVTLLINGGTVTLGSTATKRSGISKPTYATFSMRRTLSVGDTVQLALYQSNSSSVARSGYARLGISRSTFLKAA